MTLRLDPSAGTALRDVVNQLRQTFIALEFPASPQRLAVYADAASLPTLEAGERAIAYCDDVGAGTPCMVSWDGQAWRRSDTNATV